MLDFPRWKVILVVSICTLGVFFASPNFFATPPQWLPARTVNLGLDLKGGVHLLLEVDFNSYFKEQVENLKDDVRNALREEKIGYRYLNSVDTIVSFALRDLNEKELAIEQIKDIDNNLEVNITNDGYTKVTYNEESREEAKKRLLEQSIEIVRRRIDETGTREPTIQRQGDNRILVQVPGFDDPERLKQLIGKTAKLTFHLVSRDGNITSNEMVLKEEDTGQEYVLNKRPVLTGELLVDARTSTGQDGEPVVSFRFNTQGARKFGEFSQEHVGDLFAIVLDKKVISAPVIREPILGGSGQISGNFTFESAHDLALLLRAGALPAPLKVVEERTVGPSLGADSIAAGKKAAIIGILLVMAFMLIYYKTFGMFSNVALIVNMVLILAALSILQATLTLPGIAGIVLTIGMAVDANVLIFERIREEAQMGKSSAAAVSAGFSRAFKTIIDSNITTLIAALLLYYFGSGSVRGFAVTLSFGIIASMFTAILLTRMLIVLWVRSRRQKELPL